MTLNVSSLNFLLLFMQSSKLDNTYYRSKVFWQFYMYLSHFVKHLNAFNMYLSIDTTLNLTQTITYCLKIIMEYKSYYYTTTFKSTKRNKTFSVQNQSCMHVSMSISYYSIHSNILFQQICCSNLSDTIFLCFNDIQN